jgi:hypothetical protein
MVAADVRRRILARKKLPSRIAPDLLSTPRGHLLLSSRYALCGVVPDAWPNQSLNRNNSVRSEIEAHKLPQP